MPSNEPCDAPLIAVFGLFHGTNLGNEATLEALLVNLRSRLPGARFVCISPSGSPLGDRFDMPFQPIETLPVARYFWRLPASSVKNALVSTVRLVTEGVRYWRAVKALRGFDLLLIAGTGVMEDYGQGSLDLPMSMLRWTRAARSAGANVAYLSVGAGPITKRASRRLLRCAARGAGLRSYRDSFSRTYMDSIGLDITDDAVVPDLAFSLPDPVRGGGWPPKVIGVGVMRYQGWHQREDIAAEILQAYVQKITTFVEWLAEQGLEVRLLIGDTRADPSVVDQLLAGLPTGANVHAPPIRNVDDLLSELTRTDLVIATRYHNLLLALLAEKPVIAISYSNKCAALMEYAGLGEYSQPIEELDVARLQRQFQSLAGSPEPPLEPIRLANENARKALASQYQQTVRFLSSTKGS